MRSMQVGDVGGHEREPPGVLLPHSSGVHKFQCHQRRHFTADPSHAIWRYYKTICSRILTFKIGKQFTVVSVILGVFGFKKSLRMAIHYSKDHC